MGIRLGTKSANRRVRLSRPHPKKAAAASCGGELTHSGPPWPTPTRLRRIAQRPALSIAVFNKSLCPLGTSSNSLRAQFDTSVFKTYV